MSTGIYPCGGAAPCPTSRATAFALLSYSPTAARDENQPTISAALPALRADPLRRFTRSMCNAHANSPCVDDNWLASLDESPAPARREASSLSRSANCFCAAASSSLDHCCSFPTCSGGGIHHIWEWRSYHEGIKTLLLTLSVLGFHGYCRSH